MIITTTDGVEGREIVDYLGVVSGECVYGANFVRDWFASIRDVVGGRAQSYETVLRDGRHNAVEDMASEARMLGADAIVGDTMMMVSANGTAVKLR